MSDKTVKVNQNWIDSGKNACPYCGAGKIYDSKPIFNQDGADNVEIKWSCAACKDVWFEYYTLYGIRLPGQVGVVPVATIKGDSHDK